MLFGHAGTAPADCLTSCCSHRALTDADIELMVGNKLGQTPLHLAACFGSREVADWLLTCKADVNVTDKGGETALHHAARTSKLNVVKLLLGDYRTDLLVKNSAGQSACDLAEDCCPLSTCQHEAIESLLKERMKKDAARREASRPKGLAALPIGTVVTVSGLASATQHNGKQGTVLEWNDSTQRFVVELDEGAHALRTLFSRAVPRSTCYVPCRVSFPTPLPFVSVAHLGCLLWRRRYAGPQRSEPGSSQESQAEAGRQAGRQHISLRHGRDSVLSQIVRGPHF